NPPFTPPRPPRRRPLRLDTGRKSARFLCVTNLFVTEANMDSTQAARTLEVIRTLMERTCQYRLLTAWAGLAAGSLAPGRAGGVRGGVGAGLCRLAPVDVRGDAHAGAGARRAGLVAADAGGRIGFDAGAVFGAGADGVLLRPGRAPVAAGGVDALLRPGGP